MLAAAGDVRASAPRSDRPTRRRWPPAQPDYTAAARRTSALTAPDDGRGAVALDRARRPARRRDDRAGRVLSLGEHGVRAGARVGRLAPPASGQSRRRRDPCNGGAERHEHDTGRPGRPRPRVPRRIRAPAADAARQRQQQAPDRGGRDRRRRCGRRRVAPGRPPASSRTGAQPAEALPDSTLAYFSIDLDPSGGQKIEAIKTLRKFPGFTDKIDLETDDDLREQLFEEVTSVRRVRGPRLRRRRQAVAGLAARRWPLVDLGEDEPTPVGVVQITDAGKAEDGLADADRRVRGRRGRRGRRRRLGGRRRLDGRRRDPGDRPEGRRRGRRLDLAGDASFEEWTGEAGDDGFMSMYVAQGRAKYLDELRRHGRHGR